MKRYILSGLLALVVTTAEASRPKTYLEVKVSPPLQVYDILGGNSFTARARIIGDEVEEYYCPTVMWKNGRGLDMVVSSEESDCPPFTERNDFPRYWSRGFKVPSPGRYEVCVELVKMDKVITKACADALVQGGGY